LEEENRRLRSHKGMATYARNMTTAERNTLYPNPVDMQIVRNTTTGTFQVYYDGAWNDVNTLPMIRYNAVWVDAGGIRAPGVKPPTLVAHGALETPAWSFANQAIVGNQETVSFNIRVPYRMDRTIGPSITIGWSATAVAGDCRWQLEYLWTSENESTIAAAEGTIGVTTTVSAVAEGLRLTEFVGINNPSATDVCLHCRLTRLSAAAADTLADSAELHGVCFVWTSNTLGGVI